MSLESSTSTVDYLGNGVTDTFSIPFAYHATDDVKAYKGTTGGTLTLLTYTTNYTLSDAGPISEGEGQSLTMVVAPAVGQTLRISRVVALTQPLDLTAQGTYAPSSIENALDRLEMQIQQINDGTISVDSYVAGAVVGSGTPVAVDAAAAVVGVAVTSSHSDHKHSVTVASPAALPMDNSGSAGVATSLARSDHVHPITTYSSAPAAVGTADAGTSGLAPSRGNHVHAHGDQLGGTLHADVTTSVDGFMVAADKLKLNGLRSELLQFFDDFTGKVPDTAYRWGATYGAGGGSVAEGTDEWGAVDMNASASATGSVLLQSGLLASPQRSMYFACRMRITSNTSQVIRIGLDSGSGVNYARFATAAAEWFGETKDGASATSTTTGKTADTSFHTFEFILSSSSVAFYYDGTLVLTVAATLPAASTPLRAYLYIANSSASQRNMYIDFVRVRWLPTLTIPEYRESGQDMVT
jgi:hypothetical protein